MGLERRMSEAVERCPCVGRGTSDLRAPSEHTSVLPLYNPGPRCPDETPQGYYEERFALLVPGLLPLPWGQERCHLSIRVVSARRDARVSLLNVSAKFYSWFDLTTCVS